MDNPVEVGADRIADGVAAYRLYGGPVIVVDFGTGTTFDYITERENMPVALLRQGLVFVLKRFSIVRLSCRKWNM